MKESHKYCASRNPDEKRDAFSAFSLPSDWKVKGYTIVTGAQHLVVYDFLQKWKYYVISWAKFRQWKMRERE